MTGQNTANMQSLTAAFGMKLVVSTSIQMIAPGKVIAYYRDKLKKYGKVIECHTSEHGGDVHVNAGKDDSDGSKESEMRRRQHRQHHRTESRNRKTISMWSPSNRQKRAAARLSRWSTSTPAASKAISDAFVIPMERRASSPVSPAGHAAPFLARNSPLLYLEIQWNIPVINVAPASRTAHPFAPDAMLLRSESPDPNPLRPLERLRKPQSNSTHPTLRRRQSLSNGPTFCLPPRLHCWWQLS